MILSGAPNFPYNSHHHHQGTRRRMTGSTQANPEKLRLEQQRQGAKNWRLWGPYLAERAWGTVREDYSPAGNAWEYFGHDQAHLRAYRWNEDGLAGICDEQQRLCFALALWNGHDPILKERAFGLTGKQGNHGEDVKEYYFYEDATPSHSYLRYLYKYPQQAYPYSQLLHENAHRGRDRPAFNLLDTGIFNEQRYWDVTVEYAKASPTQMHIRINAANRGPEAATLWLLPTLWFRNTWSWGDATNKPLLSVVNDSTGNWAVQAQHPALGDYYLYGRHPAAMLFTENETNAQQLWGSENPSPFVKDAFNRFLIEGEAAAVNPARTGTRFAAATQLEVAAGASRLLELVISAEPLQQPFSDTAVTLSTARAETDTFYHNLLPEACQEDRRILRQALSGLIWNKQFYHYDVQRWLEGDQLKPAGQRTQGRNHHWRQLRAADVISMPDCWEYPWFAAWDLAYHCAALAHIDVDFAKEQIELLLSERYLHPNGQLPAYEWFFGEVNPPVHAMGALKVFRAERIQRDGGDLDYLQRVFHKLLLNYAWWLNRKDRDGHNLFEGGFLGLDNISVYNRSLPLETGYSLKQADATGWMAMFALNMTVIALEITTRDPNYEEIAIQCYQQFLSIADAIAGGDEGSVSLWDHKAGFFKDVIVAPDGSSRHIDVYSWVGLIPLFACEIIDQRLLVNAPRFREQLQAHKGGMFHGRSVCACPEWENHRGEHLLSLVDSSMLPRLLERLLDADEFLSDYGVRSVSRRHASQQDLGELPGIGRASIKYLPGESNSGMFGGNSNWRGPVWLPTNYSLIQALEKFHRFLGPDFTVPVPQLNNRELNLQQVTTLLADRLVNLYRRDASGNIPALRADCPIQDDPHWKDLYLFYEYFHAETGQGLGAAHQTGWTALLANLVMRHYRKDIPNYWTAAAAR